MIRNKIKDLTDPELDVVLEAVHSYTTSWGVGETLRRYIQYDIGAGILSEESSITELYEDLTDLGIKWPFRKFTITAEVTVTKEFTLAALDDPEISESTHATFHPADIDPTFTEQRLYTETLDYKGKDYVDFSMEVRDDRGRRWRIEEE